MYGDKHIGMTIQELIAEITQMRNYCFSQEAEGYEAVDVALGDAQRFLARARDNAYKISKEFATN